MFHITEQRAKCQVDEIIEKGTIGSNSLKSVFINYPWKSEIELMIKYGESEPNIERSAPTVNAENTQENKLISVCVRNSIGNPIYEISFVKNARRKKYIFFGELVINYNGWVFKETEDFNEVLEIIDYFSRNDFEKVLSKMQST